jgi:hypothetical protein
MLRVGYEGHCAKPIVAVIPTRRVAFSNVFIISASEFHMNSGDIV